MNSAERHVIMTISPTRTDPAVLRAMGTVTPTADDPLYLKAYAEAVADLRAIVGCPKGRAYIIPGSGTLGMEMMVVNWLETGDKILVAPTGYWGMRLAEVAARHGAEVCVLQGEPGTPQNLEAIEAELAQGGYKALAWTDVDSSTGVRAPNKALAELAKRYGALSLVDGICAVGAEVFNQDSDGIDVYLGASPKALSTPAGLILLTASERAMAAFAERKRPVSIYSLDLAQWTPVFEALEDGRFAYFNTPAINLVMALSVSLKQVLAEGLQVRWERHKRLAQAFRAAAGALGLGIVARSDVQANSLSVLRYPAGVGRELIAAMREEGVLIAGGYHPTIGQETFRIGHLGLVSENDVFATIAALERSLKRLGHGVRLGDGLQAAQCALQAYTQAPLEGMLTS